MSTYSVFEKRLSEQLGGGGQGDIFRIENSDLAFKRYKDPKTVQVRSLEALVQWFQELPLSDQKKIKSTAAWPMEVIYRNDKSVAGFVMPLAPKQAFVDRIVGSASTKVLLEIGMLMDQIRPAYKAWLPELQAKDRLEIVENFLQMVHFFHSNNIVLGDISGRNFAWRPDLKSLFFMDCDAYMQIGNMPASPQLETPAFKDPDPLPALIQGGSTKDTDNYKVALVVMRVATRLMHIAPIAGEEISSVAQTRLENLQNELGVNHLSGRFQELWRKTARGAGLRPSAAEWLAAIQNVREIIPLTPPAPRDPSLPRPERPREWIYLK